MADITPSGVAPSSGARFYDGIAGATITAGQSLYLDSTTNTVKLADADAQASAAAVGIATHGSAAGQPIRAQNGGKMTLGGLTKGTPYFVSATAGGICPFADLAPGDYVTFLGIAESTTVLQINILASGITI